MSNEENLTLKQRVDRAISVGTPPSVLKVLFPGWADEQEHADLETVVRQDLGLAPETKSESTVSPLESLVRHEMEHPSPPEPERLIAPDNPEETERRVRRTMNLPTSEANSE